MGRLKALEDDDQPNINILPSTSFAEYSGKKINDQRSYFY